MAIKEKELKKPSVGVNKGAVGVTISKAEEGIIENPSDFFGGNTQDSVVDMVRYMRKIDPMLYGFTNTRKNAVLSHKREIVGSGAEAEFVRGVFSGINNFQNKISQMLNSIDVGYSVTELIWEEVEGKYYVDLKARHQGKFKFDEFGVTWLITDDGEKKVEDIKFPVMTYDEEFGNKYGNGVYQTLYWYWFIKKESVKFWSIFCERFAVPVIVAEKPVGISPEDEATIDEFIEDFRSATSISLPKGVALSFLEARQTGSIDTFEKFIEFLNKSMAIAYLGQIDTSGVSNSTGSYARAKVQNQVREDIMLADIMFLENYINDMIVKPLVDINFSNVKEYPKWRLVINTAINAEVIEKLVQSGHNRIPIAWVSERFGIPLSDDTKPDEYMKVAETKQAGFSETNFGEQKKKYLEELNEIMEKAK